MTEKRKPIAASELIGLRTQRRSVPPPSKEAIVELRKLCQHNDTASTSRRVGREAAIALLKSYGWAGGSDSALNLLCIMALQRKSYAQP